MVRPVCIEHFNLGDGRLSFFLRKIILTKFYIVKIHCKRVFVYKTFKSLIIERQKSVKRFNRFGNVIIYRKRVFFSERRLPALNRVYNIFFNRLFVAFRNFAVYKINLCGFNRRTLFFGDKLNTLRRRVRTLVKLTGERFDRKNEIRVFVERFGYNIKLGLGKNRHFTAFKKVFFNVFNVVSIYDTK